VQLNDTIKIVALVTLWITSDTKSIPKSIQTFLIFTQQCVYDYEP